jgi:hypothetical protein
LPTIGCLELAEAIEHVSTLRIAKRSEVLEQLFARWGSLDVRAALEFAQEMPKASDYPKAVLAVIQGGLK